MSKHPLKSVFIWTGNGSIATAVCQASLEVGVFSSGFREQLMLTELMLTELMLTEQMLTK